jgi:hypothetical protein
MTTGVEGVIAGGKRNTAATGRQYRRLICRGNGYLPCRHSAVFRPVINGKAHRPGRRVGRHR